MTKKHKQATFQPTIRPSWAGAMSYIQTEEKALILEAIIKYPEETGINSVFWRETIKPDLDLQYEKFLSTCEARKQVARTYWDNQKVCKGMQLNTNSISNGIQKVCNSKDKDKDKDKSKDKVKDNMYGELKNVRLTEEQYNSLKEKCNNLDEAIEVLDTWLGTPSKTAREARGKNHYAYFKSNSWIWERMHQKPAHKESVWEHNMRVMKEMEEENANENLF